MKYEKTWEQWHEAIIKNPGRWGSFNVSPGAAAAYVGCDRKTIDRAIASDRLDAVRIKGARVVLIDSKGLVPMRVQFSSQESKSALLSAARRKAWVTRRRMG